VEVPEQIHARYRQAGREEKGRILDEFCKVTGCNRKYAVRVLNGRPPEKRPPSRRPRKPSYGPKVVSILAAVWRAAGYPWSVRLTALLPIRLPRIWKHHGLTAKVEEQLLRISPRQIDRRLREEKRRAGRRVNDGPVASRVYSFLYVSEYAFLLVIVAMAYPLLGRFVDLHLSVEELNRNLEPGLHGPVPSQPA
jgi:hypothetical protein